ncbi:MAG: hypothetical protein ACTSYJ_12085 [Candidatus Thorarchaeota archaeon]
MKIRTDSKSIALLAVFTSLVIALEIFPIPGLTDFYTPVPNFTIDWTGIPIMIVFLGLGGIFSLFTVGVMWVFIAYRNFQGAAFKGFAESFTLLGLILAKLVLRNRNLDWKKSAVVYLTFACLFRGVGMLFGNVVLFNLFMGWPYEMAFTISTIYVPWNILQAAINVVGGLFLYRLIPESLRKQAGLGTNGSDEITKYEEISEDELKTE